MKKIILIIVLIAVVAGLYWYFTQTQKALQQPEAEKPLNSNQIVGTVKVIPNQQTVFQIKKV